VRGLRSWLAPIFLMLCGRGARGEVKLYTRAKAGLLGVDGAGRAELLGWVVCHVRRQLGGSSRFLCVRDRLHGNFMERWTHIIWSMLTGSCKWSIEYLKTHASDFGILSLKSSHDRSCQYAPASVVRSRESTGSSQYHWYGPDASCCRTCPCA
jgi:hypothetical protein